MARELQIKLAESTYHLAPVKVERKKLYGWTDLKVTDKNGDLCRQVSLDSNGVTIIPSGAIKLGTINESGKWVDKSQLQAIRSDGQKAELCPSSFDSGIVLDHKATIEDVLDLIVTSVYVLNGDDASEMISKLGNDIYSFRFNYRTDYSDLQAYLLSNGQSVFILTGQKAQFDFIGLENESEIDLSEQEESLDDFDDLDFSMM